MQSNTMQCLRKGKGNIGSQHRYGHLGKRRKTKIIILNKRRFGGQATRRSEKFHFFDPKIYIICTTCQTFGGSSVGPLGGGRGWWVWGVR